MVLAPATVLQPPCLNVWWLSVALIVGSLVDLSGAVSLFFFAKRTEKKLDIPPEEGFWPAYASVFLVVLAVLYLVTATDPLRLLPNVGVAIFGRLLGGVFYGIYAWNKPGRQWLLGGLGSMNVVLLIVYVMLLQPVGWYRVWELPVACMP